MEGDEADYHGVQHRTSTMEEEETEEVDKR